MLDVVRLFRDYGVKYSRTTVDALQVKIKCPECNGKDKLWVCLDRDQYYCHKCEWTPYTVQAFLRSTLGLFGLELVRVEHEYQRTLDVADLEAHLAEEMNNLRQSLGFTEESGQNDSGRGRQRSSRAMTKIEWPEHFTPLGDIRIPRINEYALSRGFSWDEMCRLGFGGCFGGKLRGYLIIPSLEGGVLKFWQGRDAWGRENVPRYKTPSGASNTLSLFNIDEASHHEVVVVCEGVFSAMRVGPDAVATFGNKLSLEQIEMLRRRGVRHIVIFFDPDSWYVPKSVRQRKNGHRAKPPIQSVLDRCLGRFDTIRVVESSRYSSSHDPDDWGTANSRHLVSSGTGLYSPIDIGEMLLRRPPPSD